MSHKAGRPKSPKRKLKSVMLFVRATRSEVSAWRKRAGERKLSEWVRDRLNSAC
jgi:hypothetical protein